MALQYDKIELKNHVTVALIISFMSFLLFFFTYHRSESLNRSSGASSFLSYFQPKSPYALNQYLVNVSNYVIERLAMRNKSTTTINRSEINALTSLCTTSRLNVWQKLARPLHSSGNISFSMLAAYISRAVKNLFLDMLKKIRMV